LAATEKRDGAWSGKTIDSLRSAASGSSRRASLSTVTSTAVETTVIKSHQPSIASRPCGRVTTRLTVAAVATEATRGTATTRARTSAPRSGRPCHRPSVAPPSSWDEADPVVGCAGPARVGVAAPSPVRTALGLRLAVLVATRGLVRVDGVPAQCALRRRPGVAGVDTVPGAAALRRRTGFVPALVRPASTVFGVTLDVFGRPTS